MSDAPVNVFAGPLVVGLNADEQTYMDVIKGGLAGLAALPLVYPAGSRVADASTGSVYVNVGTRVAPIWVFAPNDGTRFEQIWRYQPGATDSPATRTYGDWGALYADYRADVAIDPERQRVLLFDDLLVSPCVIPDGQYKLSPRTRLQGVRRTHYTAPVTEADRFIDYPIIDVASGALFELERSVGVSGITQHIDVWALKLIRRSGATQPMLTLSTAFTAAAGDVLGLVWTDIALINNSPSVPLIRVDAGRVSGVVAELQDSVLQRGVGEGHVLELGSAVDWSFKAQGQSELDDDVLRSDVELGSVAARIGPSVRFGAQDSLQVPAFVSPQSLGASAQDRPAPQVTVLHTDQLDVATVAGEQVPQIKGAMAFGLSGQPLDGEQLSLSGNGVTTETYRFKVAPAGPNDVQIGATVSDTLQDLADVVDSVSAVWTASLADNRFSGRQLVVLTRSLIQTQERLTDRMYGTAANGQVAVFGDGTTSLPLSYSRVTLVALPLVDAGVGAMGFASISPLAQPDGFSVFVIDGRTGGVYSAERQAAVARWVFGSAAIETFSAAGPITTQLERTDRGAFLLVASGQTMTVELSAFLVQGVPYSIVRSDATDGVIRLDPGAGATIDGLSELFVPPQTGIELVFDGANYYTVGRRVIPGQIDIAPGGPAAVGMLANTVYVDATLGAADAVTLTPSPEQPLLETFVIKRHDGTAGTLTFDPSPDLVDGGATLPIGTTSVTRLIRISSGDYQTI